MKFQKLMFALLGVAILAGSAASANAEYRHHHHHHHHHRS